MYWRKIQALRLVESYIQDEELRMRCKMLLALAFVPTPSVAAAFEAIAEDLPKELNELYDYFEDQCDATDVRRSIRTLYGT